MLIVDTPILTITSILDIVSNPYARVQYTYWYYNTKQISKFDVL